MGISAGGDSGGSRRILATIINAMTPYTLHLLRRIVSEIPEIELWNHCTHETSTSPWRITQTDPINSVLWGAGTTTYSQEQVLSQFDEFKKGGRIIQWFKERDVAAVVLHGYNDMGRLRILRWCHRHGVPVLLFGDSNILCDATTGTKARLKQAILPRILKRFSGVLVCGRLGVEYYVKYGTPRERIFLYPYEPDYELVRNIQPQTIQSASEKFSLPPDRRRLVFSGRLAPKKRPDLLLSAFERIADHRPQWDLLIIGDGPLRQQLQAQLPQRLSDRVRWTGFLDDQSLVAALYRLCDVLVLPSDYEPWALVVNEAVAAGLAVVASHVVGAAAELVRDGVNGRIFRRGDLDHLTECLMDVTDPQRIDALKSASADALSDWRSRADPIQGLRKALQYCGVLGQ